MHEAYEPILTALNDLSEAVRNSSEEKRSFIEVLGGLHPAVDKSDLLYLIDDVSDAVVQRAPDEVTPDISVSMLVSRINLLSGLIASFWNGNGVQAVPSFVASLAGIKAWISSAWPLREVVEPGSLPAKLAREARNAKLRLDEILSNFADVDAKLKTIVDAHQAAESLPTDVEELRQVRATMMSLNVQTTADTAAVKEMRSTADNLMTSLSDSEVAAAQHVANCEEAYRITTSKGLAGAFDQRATSLNRSMWVWVGGLVLALIAVATIGHNRVGALTQILAGDPKWGTVILNSLLSAISVGAPLWFAWVSTKQIGERFRLAEDYGFKASVAKAYEGYRREAVQIDKKFEARLFDIALTRLEEAPLRMISSEAHGSPWHEMLSEARDNPTLRERVVGAFKKAAQVEPAPGSSVTSTDPA